ncbi:MAG: alanine--tRNA ligase [Patescibacteria group bacterium]|nr:alanine--tRNA ligase [Patescibacteria group bacterium]
MTSSEIRTRFLRFFDKRGHTVIPSASLVTSDEKGITNPTLFNTAGMQPLIPYLLGKPYEKDGKVITRLVDSQKCLRTTDLDDVGDKRHATFFEMLGNWSLGDYFKREAIEWSFEFLTSQTEGLGLDPHKLYVTVFEGDLNAPRDDEASGIWREIFKKNNIDCGGDTSKGEKGRIFFMPAKNNWWEAGDNGPCGPDSEMFFDAIDRFKGGLISLEDYIDAEDKSDLVEVWNDVFMQYEKKDGKVVGKLPKPSVDTGAGLERLAMTMQGVDNIYDTDLLKPVMDLMSDDSLTVKNKRIIADHLRASAFLITDGVTPSNTDRGYILRRLIRRAIVNTSDKKFDKSGTIAVVDALISTYKDAYPDLEAKKDLVVETITTEAVKFEKTINDAIHEFNKLINEQDAHQLTANIAFILFTSFGLPLEITLELATIKKPIAVEDNISEKFTKLMSEHQALSRAGAEQKFKGGLADANDPMVVRYHTATHLLHQALHDVLGEEIGNQKGSNITADRLRFDFTGIKLTEEQKKRVEDIVNDKIAAALPVNKIVMPLSEAEKTGARHFFGEKYSDNVSIYFIGKASNPPAVEDLATAYSKEFCGGPHVSNTKELSGPEGKWRFKIQKEEAVAQGVRRIKAVLA